jgi:uncharacterized membrane protein (DUF373 family)
MGSMMAGVWLHQPMLLLRSSFKLTHPQLTKTEIGLETLITKVQKVTVWVLAAMLLLVVVLSTLHLGVLIAQEIWTPPRFLIRVQGLLEVFGYFLLVLIGVELLETLKAYIQRDVIQVRVVLEVALIAMARKVIIQEPNNVPSLTLFAIAALILALAVAFYFERQAKRESSPGQDA